MQRVALVLLACGFLPNMHAQTASVPPAHPSFLVYDNFFYKGRPDIDPSGMIRANIIYEGMIWPNKINYGSLPDAATFQATVRAHSLNPGPIVLDVERLPLHGSKKIMQEHLKVLQTLADWAHLAAPGKIVGYYGTNTLSRLDRASRPYARQLAQHVDAFFPSLYTFSSDRKQWTAKAVLFTKEDRALAHSKPVYCYIWPQYHDGTPQQFVFIDASYWLFQLQTAYQLCDGIVIWGPSKFSWQDSTGWWQTTQKFVQALPNPTDPSLGNKYATPATDRLSTPKNSHTASL